LAVRAGFQPAGIGATVFLALPTWIFVNKYLDEKVQKTIAQMLPGFSRILGHTDLLPNLYLSIS
jgi:hypothetical protein